MSGIDSAIISLANAISRYAAVSEQLARAVEQNTLAVEKQGAATDELARSVIAQTTAVAQLTHVMTGIRSSTEETLSAVRFISSHTKRRKLKAVT